MNIPYVAPEVRTTLPVSRWAVSELILRMQNHGSNAEVLGALEAHCLYGIQKRGANAISDFPAWQFIWPAPYLIKKILPHLSEKPGSEIHIFWTVQRDELNELSPAEVLAGMPYETREFVAECQRKYMVQTSQERIKRLLSVVKNLDVYL
ncbi:MULTISPECIES: hypothetical protein [unclassified Herbaspirillum]|uniref:hypothetical protein n=1 Tax=unclassified Herbaspirillum TaxID=2624150 RepID=UPI000E2F18C9|nr:MULTISPECIES: hypothetical protein [unclassified Herbaspirillum]RFB70844.1 hypothetical protein DZB54_09435 [Herbaspirillum sp. 3R-3a1]TFI08631.1 hypothetical protein E4P32_10820 [Herbaspirillum sp. 3R11]TFI15046.1 hypothetical protein E4P31_10815 [Herbaspirillum sp. 3R-11]TFI29765.1 hypothetical protein E4P30_05725 [Herbaspirillum sp. 3C11]